MFKKEDFTAMSKRNNKYNNVGLYYFFISILISLFVVYAKNETTQYIDIPHLEINTLPIYIILAIGLFPILSMILKRIIRYDSVVCLLILRIFLLIFSSVINGVGDKFALNIVDCLLCLFIYLLFLNFINDPKITCRVINIFFLIICIQTIMESFSGSVSFFSGLYSYKHDLTIPIGSSNAIASKLIPLFAYVFMQQEKKYVKVVYLLLFLVSIALTKSRSGIICATIVLAFLFINDKPNIKWSKILKVLLIPIALLLLFSFLQNSLVGGFIFSSNRGTFGTRIELILKGFNLFSLHPIVGCGLSGYTDNFNPHNFVIHILSRSGILGLIIFLTIAIKLFNFIKPYTNDFVVKGCMIAVFAILFQGLFENVLFNYIEDIVLWFFIGNMIARTNYLSNYESDDLI